MLKEKGKSIQFPFEYFSNKELVKQDEFLDFIDLINGLLKEKNFEKITIYKNSIQILRSLFYLSPEIFLDETKGRELLNIFDQLSQKVIEIFFELKTNENVINLFFKYFQLAIDLKQIFHPSISNELNVNIKKIIEKILSFYETADLFQLSTSNAWFFFKIYHKEYW